jgi:hypothetical protein
VRMGIHLSIKAKLVLAASDSQDLKTTSRLDGVVDSDTYNRFIAASSSSSSSPGPSGTGM